MKGARVLPISLLLSLAVFFPLGAESGYLPPNPITPPVVSPPSYAPEGTVSPVEAPVVSLPEVSGLSPQADPKKTPATGNKAGAGSGAANKAGSGAAAGKSVKSASKALPDDLSSVSALTLLGLAEDNPLMGALSGSSAEAGGIDALTNLLSGTGDGSKGGGEALKKAITLMQREKAATAPSASLPDATAANASVANGEGTRSVSVSERVVSGGEIVRFMVNGTDVGKSVTALVSSAIARDGSFLLTGDRTYAGGDRWLTETFYLLCRKSGPGTYALYADIAQSQPNANSFLYRLARKTPISGRLEGDLIVFGGKDPDWQLDLAIRLFSASVTGRTGR